MRRIWFITGSRADYDLMAPVALELQKRPETQVGLVICAVHLSPFHGLSVKQVEDDKLTVVAKVETLVSSETWIGRSKSFGNLVTSLTHIFELSSERPDLVVIAGDREEAMAGVIVANFLGIHVVHLFGGDRCLASDIDEVFRPAISKLSHFHFVACEDHRKRLISMGERTEHIWNHGAPSLDRLTNTPEIDSGELSRQLGLDVNQQFFLVIFHPAPTLAGMSPDQQIRNLIEGIVITKRPMLISYPNADPGNVAMRRVIDEFASRSDLVVPYTNLSRQLFVGVYRRCAAVIGNSSSIVIESPFLKVPAILVGPRQNLRTIASNTLRVENTPEEVAAACEQVLFDKDFRKSVSKCTSIYGDGYSSPRIADTLLQLELSQDTLLKTICY